MDADHALLNFKLSALRIALSTVMKNVSHHQVIPIDICTVPFFKTFKIKLHYTKQVG
jgi:hypothetical protein